VGEGEEGYSYGVVGEMGYGYFAIQGGGLGDEVGRGDEFVKRWVIVFWLVRKPGKPSLCGVGVKGESGGKPPAVQRRLLRPTCAGVP
jgi:hypothetical protein